MEEAAEIPLPELEADVPGEHLAEQPAVDNDIIERVVRKNKKEVLKARKQINFFLERNGFPEMTPNCMKKGRFLVTFPLHEAVKQNDPNMTMKLMIFGANAKTKDTWGCTAYHYAKGRASHQKVREVFAKLGMSPTSPRWSEGIQASKLVRTPPPRGWERFFAKVAKDPLVPWC